MSGTAAQPRSDQREMARLNVAKRVAEEMKDERLETYSEALLKITSRLVEKITFGRLRLRAFGVCVLIFFLVTACTSALSISASNSAAVKDIAAIFAFHCWGACVAVLQLRSSWFFANLLTDTLSTTIINSFCNPNDMRDVLTWLRRTFAKRRQFLFCLTASVLLTPLGLFGIFLAGHGEWINTGSILLSLTCWFLGATGWYFLIPAVSLSSRLRRYKLYLLDVDPANSQAIKAICSMMHAALLTSASIATLFTTGIFLIAPGDLRLQVSFSVVCAWGPLLFTMLYYQYSLATIIRKAKTQALLPLERFIATAQEEMRGGTAEIDGLTKLMDLHGRFSSTNNTALDWRGFITTVNTLLLPLLSFVVAKISAAD
ncbi:hypothetical protein [Roseateles chitinivorans]|uniref:hypothetical protein n=1 Tax=Roseateles chitinivorans TaxID=2917965 RepID=UPI003D6714D3